MDYQWIGINVGVTKKLGLLYISSKYSATEKFISAVDDFFDQWDPSTATPMDKVYG